MSQVWGLAEEAPAAEGSTVLSDLLQWLQQQPAEKRAAVVACAKALGFKAND